MPKTLFSTQSDNNQIQCQTCAQFCTLKPGQRGLCGVRENIDGQIQVLNYGKVISQAVDPIEKKPFYHFLPGSLSYSIACAGCNLRCGHCQNWEISQVREIKSRSGGIVIPGDKVPTADIITAAQANGCASIAYTYTEPTVFVEYALDVMSRAKQHQLKNVWVSNGFMSAKTRQAIVPYLDAINIDLKSFGDDFYQKTCGAKLQPVLDNIVACKKENIWLELTTLIIPTLNDSPEELTQIAKFIFDKLGEDTPWHVSRFSPEISYKMQDLPATDADVVRQAVAIGKKAGLKNVYAGNI
ncbi:AmmeMemoRadiSam system radical SAM enzyme [Patescibacteria group bacterium]